jgi:hypothetical protein
LVTKYVPICKPMAIFSKQLYCELYFNEATQMKYALI